MDFPRGNKLDRGLPEQVESSAKVFRRTPEKVDYKVFIKFYAVVAGLIHSIFSFIDGKTCGIFNKMPR